MSKEQVRGLRGDIVGGIIRLLSSPEGKLDGYQMNSYYLEVPGEAIGNHEAAVAEVKKP